MSEDLAALRAERDALRETLEELASWAYVVTRQPITNVEEFTRATALTFLELLVTLVDQNAEVTARLRSWARVGTLTAWHFRNVGSAWCPRTHTFWLIVEPGFRWAVARLTNRPVEALRFTVRAFLVPPPTRSVVVRDGDRAAAVAGTKRPEDALRETLRVRAISSSSANDNGVIPRR